MIRSKLAILLAACLGLPALVACGSSSSSSSNDAGEKMDASSSADSGAPATPDCTTYCNLIMAACTGSNQQFSTMANCMHSCSAVPVGASSDATGNTLGCRTH